MGSAIAISRDRTIFSPVWHGSHDFREERRERELLRLFISEVSGVPKLKRCGCTVRLGHPGSARAILDRTISCRCKWLCPTCGFAAYGEESAKLKYRLLGWTGRGGAVAMLSLSQSHTPDDRLGQLWSSLEAGWAALVRGSGWTADKQAYGVRAYIRIAEVVYSWAWGWHPHFHVILLLDQRLEQPDMDRLKASLTARFFRGVSAAGGRAGPEGQDLQPMIPGTEWELADYCFKGTARCWTDGESRNPMAIAADVEATGEGMPLWREFVAAVSDRTRMQVSPSRGIDVLCRPGPLHYLD